MPKVHRIDPPEAAKLMSVGHCFVDVRTEEEFEEGHIPNAYNVPFLRLHAGDMVENPEFGAVIRATFAPGAPLILGCQAGIRSLKAARNLVRAGLEELWELRTGWDGCRDHFGRLSPGWVRLGLPVETGAPVGRCYADLKRGLPHASDP